MPNFKFSIGRVLQNATRLATEEVGDLLLFRYIDLSKNASSNESSIPSWVSQLFRDPISDIDPNHLRSTFNASKGKVSFPEMKTTFNLNRRQDDPKVINVQGFEAARVHSVENVISKQQLKSSETIADLFHQIVIEQELITEEGHGKPIEGLQKYELGPVLLAGTHLIPSQQKRTSSPPAHSPTSSAPSAQLPNKAQVML